MRKSIPQVIKSKIIDEFNNTTQTQLELAKKYKIGLSTIQLILRTHRLEQGQNPVKPSKNLINSVNQVGGTNIIDISDYITDFNDNFMTDYENNIREHDNNLNNILKTLNDNNSPN